jgi:micrococcal nuclease
MEEEKNFTLTVIIILVASFIVWLLSLYITSKFDNYETNQEHETSDLNYLKREKIEVIKVIDWDTVKIKTKKSNEENIRMIGLDAPEKSTTRYWYSECFWKEAANHLTQLLSWIKILEVEYDSTQASTDKYWRILWYLILSWINLNKQMIKDWYWFEYTYNVPYKYQKEFKKAENYARSNNLWLRNANTCNWERKEIK